MTLCVTCRRTVSLSACCRRVNWCVWCDGEMVTLSEMYWELTGSTVNLIHLASNSTPCLDVHVDNVCKSSNFHLRALHHIWKHISEDAATSIACSAIHGRLDYGNSILYGTSAANLSKLWRVQNSTWCMNRNKDQALGPHRSDPCWCTLVAVDMRRFSWWKMETAAQDRSGLWHMLTRPCYSDELLKHYRSASVMVLAVTKHASFMRNVLKYADRNKTQYVVKICRIRPRSHICIQLAYGNTEGVELTKVHTGTSFSHFQPWLH